MYIIISYDVDTKNCNKLMKILRKYLYHVHNSVFEGEITDGNLKRLKEEIMNILLYSDRLIIYKLSSSKALKKDIYGDNQDQNIII